MGRSINVIFNLMVKLKLTEILLQFFILMDTHPKTCEALNYYRTLLDEC